MYNRRYDKIFLMLRQEATGYSMEHQTPWGSCVMEIKNGVGKIQITVQGLRPTAYSQYEVYMIGREGERTRSIFCGEVVPDAKGQGQLKWEFNPNHIANQDLTVEEVHTIAIIVQRGKEIAAPLVAYVEEKKQWKPYFKTIKVEEKIEIEEKMIMVAEACVLPKIELEITFPKKEVVEPKTIEAKIVEAKIIEAKIIEPKIIELKTIESKTIEPKIIEPKTVEAEIIELKTIEPKMIEVKTIETKTIEKEEVTKPEEKVEEENYHGSFRGLLEKFRQELKELNDEGIFNAQDMKKIQDAGALVKENSCLEASYKENQEKIKRRIEEKAIEEKAIKEKAIEEKAIKEKAIKEKEIEEKKIEEKEIEEKVTNNIDVSKSMLFEENIDFTPFLKDKALWKCITLDEFILLEQVPLEWQRRLFFLYPMKKYQHFIYKEENGVCTIGVPSHVDYDEFEKQEAKDLGFSEFYCMEKSEVGYWIYEKK